MLFANDYNDNRVHIDETHSNQEYYCPYCGETLIVKKGEKLHYFSHRPRSSCSDTWAHSGSGGYDTSLWHNEWQSLFPKENQEVKLVLGDTKHRADVLIDRTVVEFQHSIMPVAAFDNRNNFYFNLGYKVVWLFDLSELYESGQITYRSEADLIVFDWKNPKKAFNSYDIQSGCIDLFFQLGNDRDKNIVRVIDVSQDGFEKFHTTKFISANDFLAYVGLQDGVCVPPCRDDLEQNHQFQLFKEKYNVRLNKQQERAVLAVEGANLLLAVPGSGKTTVLVTRLGHMVINKNISPESILAITYNKDAADEMKDRFTAQFGSIGGQIDFRTINSLSLKIYGDHYQQIHCRKKRNIGTDERRQIIRDVYREANGEFASENDIQELSTAISYIKNMMLTEEQIHESEADYPHLYEMYQAYEAKLNEQYQMDFDDQMVFALKILQDCADVANELRLKHKYICVDEAQDTSKIQHEIIKIIAQGNNIFMVGDEDQSIYGFRAAYPKALLNFRYDYVNPYILRMERNYRSTTKIVEKAQTFISRNKGRYEKNMVADRGEGDEVQPVSVRSREEQYMHLLDVAKTTETETAFLYRDNESAIVLVDLLLRNGISFKFRKPEMNFFEIRIVKDIIAYLTLAIDPCDANSLDAIINKGIIYLPKKQRDWAVRNCKNNHITVFDAVDGQMEYLKYSDRYRGTLFRQVMRRVSEVNSSDAISLLLEFGYQKYLDEKSFDNGKVEILQILAKQEPNIRNFLKRIVELQQLLSKGFEAEKGSNIVLSTIHSSKGLEYDSVYMVDVYDGRFPSARPNIFCQSKDSANAEQEERRLFYVGITRAKNKLNLFKIEGRTSSYVDELFPEVKEAHSQTEARQNKISTGNETVRYKEEQNLDTSNLNEKYRNLPMKRVNTVHEILNENYDQEEYLIYDNMVGFRRVKCTICGNIQPERDFAKFETCNKGVCTKCEAKIIQ